MTTCGLAPRQKWTGEKHDFVLRRGLLVSKSILIEKAEGQEYWQTYTLYYEIYLDT